MVGACYPSQCSLVAELHVPAAHPCLGWGLLGYLGSQWLKTIWCLEAYTPPASCVWSGRKVDHQPHVHTRGATGSKDHLSHLISQILPSSVTFSTSCPEPGLNQPIPSSKSCSSLKRLLHLKGGLTSWLSMTGYEARTMFEKHIYQSTEMSNFSHCLLYSAG